MNNDESDKKPSDVNSKGPKFLSARFVLALLAFLGFVNVYLSRVNLSVALVAMVKPLSEDNTGNLECPTSSNNKIKVNASRIKDQTFDWDREMQGTILGSFFYGYIITQIPGGWLGGKYGGKRLFGFGILFASVLTLLTPLAAQWNVYVLIATRILDGFVQGVTFPAMHAMWAEWAPSLERSKLVTFSYAGSEFGTVVALPLAGVIIEQLGWQYVFYIFGAVGCIWFTFWMLLVYEKPSMHPRISEAELMYITSTQNLKKRHIITLYETPWLSFVKSPAFWAITVAHFSHNWGFYTLLTCLPTFMKDVLQFDISQNSLLSSLPYLFMWLTEWTGGYMVDLIREKGLLTTVAARKLMLAIGLLGPGACLVGVGYVGCDYYLAVILLCLAGGLDGVSLSGYLVNHLDIAPLYAGTLLGITNTIATIPGFLGPQVVGWLTSTSSTSEEWRSVFFVTSEIYLFGVIIFSIFAKGVEQDWAKHDEISDQDETSPLLHNQRTVNKRDDHIQQ